MSEKKYIVSIRYKGYSEPWREHEVGDFYEFKNGVNKGKEFFGHGNPIVNFTDVFQYRGLKASQLQGRVDLDANEIANYNVQKGDVFFTRTSETIEEIGYPSVMLDSPEKTVFSGFVLRCRAKGNDPLHLLFKRYAFFTARFRKEMTKKSSMTTRALTSGTAIKQMNFIFPNEQVEQEKIGQFFLDFDNQIAFQKRKHEKLLNIKKAMLEKMFPKDGADVPEIRFEGFSDKWQRRNITELGFIFIGLVTTMTKSYCREGVILIRNSDIKDNCLSFSDEPIYLDPIFAAANENRRLRKGDVVTVHTGDVGTSAVISAEEEGAIGFATINTRPDTRVLDSGFLSIFLNTNTHKAFAVANSTGDGRANYNLKDFFKVTVPIPHVLEQKKISEYFMRLNQLILLHNEELKKLKNIKKAMLEKMFV